MLFGTIVHHAHHHKDPLVKTRRATAPQDDLVAWRRIEVAWKGAQRASGQRAAGTNAVDFLHEALIAENTQPKNPEGLSPLGYAFMFHEFVRQVGYMGWSTFDRATRQKAIVDLGHCAYRAIRHRTLAGRLASREWELFAQSAIGSLVLPIERQATLVDVLDSDLHETYRFWASKGGLPSDWVVPDVRVRMELLLPPQEHARFPALVWTDGPKSAQANMAVVQAYCPQLYTVLAGLAPSSAWAKRKEMLAFALPFMPKKEALPTMELPVDFAGPA